MPRKKKEVTEAPVEKVEKEVITPGEYFDKLKESIQSDGNERYKEVLAIAEKQFKKFKTLNQVEAAKRYENYIRMLKKEIEIVDAGFTEYIPKNVVRHYIDKLADKSIFMCELGDYTRDVPDEIVDKLDGHMELFDHLYVMFTDYTKKVSKKIDKKTREKDPILFGCLNVDKEGYNFVVGPRMYVIGDWVDEFCELTIQEVIATYEKKEGLQKDKVLKTAKIPTTKEESVKAATEYARELEDNANDGINITVGGEKKEV